MAKISFIFIATTLASIFALGSVLMGFLSTVLKEVSNDASAIAANFCSTFLASAISIAVLIAAVFILTGKNLKL